MKLYRYLLTTYFDGMNLFTQTAAINANILTTDTVMELVYTDVLSKFCKLKLTANSYLDKMQTGK